MKKTINYLIDHKVLVMCCTFLLLIEAFLVLLATESYGNKNLDKYVFGLNAKNIDNEMMAILVETAAGTGKYSSVTSFPDNGYVFNKEKSQCMDSLGNIIDNELSYDIENKTLSMTVSNTSKCYIYFDLIQ